MYCCTTADLLILKHAHQPTLSVESACCSVGRLLAGMRLVNDEYKLKQNIRIAMLYLEDDDAVNAEIFIKKAATLIANCKVSATLSFAEYPLRTLFNIIMVHLEEDASA